jgi:hypothetical protein
MKRNLSYASFVTKYDANTIDTQIVYQRLAPKLLSPDKDAYTRPKSNMDTTTRELWREQFEKGTI